MTVVDKGRTGEGGVEQKYCSLDTKAMMASVEIVFKDIRLCFHQVKGSQGSRRLAPL